MAFKNIVDKGENADNQHFLLFLHCFSTLRQVSAFESHLFCHQSSNSLNSVMSKILWFDKENVKKCEQDTCIAPV